MLIALPGSAGTVALRSLTDFDEELARIDAETSVPLRAQISDIRNRIGNAGDGPLDLTESECRTLVIALFDQLALIAGLADIDPAPEVPHATKVLVYESLARTQEGARLAMDAAAVGIGDIALNDLNIQVTP